MNTPWFPSLLPLDYAHIYSATKLINFDVTWHPAKASNPDSKYARNNSYNKEEKSEYFCQMYNKVKGFLRLRRNDFLETKSIFKGRKGWKLCKSLRIKRNR